MEIENPAMKEIYLVDYTIIFPDENRERQNGRFRVSGSQPGRQEITNGLARELPDFNWQSARLVDYTIYRLMNNDAEIVADRGQIDLQQINRNISQTGTGENTTYNAG